MTRDERRAAMPHCTEFIDAMREHFSIAGIRAEENGHRVEWGTTLGDVVALVPVMEKVS